MLPPSNYDSNLQAFGYQPNGLWPPRVANTRLIRKKANIRGIWGGLWGDSGCSPEIAAEERAGLLVVDPMSCYRQLSGHAVLALPRKPIFPSRTSGVGSPSPALFFVGSSVRSFASE